MKPYTFIAALLVACLFSCRDDSKISKQKADKLALEWTKTNLTGAASTSHSCHEIGDGWSCTVTARWGSATEVTQEARVIPIVCGEKRGDCSHAEGCSVRPGAVITGL